MSDWHDGIHQAIKAFLAHKQFLKPSPVQEASIGPALDGKNVVAEATTGSGKTLAYLIPLVSQLRKHLKIDDAQRQRIQKKLAQKAAGYSISSSSTEDEGEPVEVVSGGGTRFVVGAMVIVPTNDLSQQVFEVLEEFLEFLRAESDEFSHIYAYHLDLTESLQHLAQRITHSKSNIKENILVSPPHRLQTLLDEKCTFLTRWDVDVTKTKVVVLDEADQILQNPTLRIPLKIILSRLSKSRQMLVFSATLPKDIKSLANVGASDSVFVRVQIQDKKIPKPVSTPVDLDNYVVELHYTQKLVFLLRLIKHVIGRAKKSRKMIVFFPTTKVMNYVYRLLNLLILENGLLDDPGKKKFSSKLTISRSAGKLDSNTRRRQLEAFNTNPFGVLLATDVASRGLDFRVDWVVSYSVGTNVDCMIHRGGRTARAGAKGVHLVFVTPQEKDLFIALFSVAGVVFKSFESTDVFADMDIRQKQTPLEVNARMVKSGLVPAEIDDTLKQVYVASGEKNMKAEMVRYKEMMENHAYDEQEKPDTEMIEEEHKQWNDYMNAVAPYYIQDAIELMHVQRYLNSTRREFFLMSEEAAITYVASYDRNDHKHTFKTETIPMGILMNSFGLLKLPRIKEIRGQVVSDFVQYKPQSGDYLDINYHDKDRQEVYKQKRADYGREIDQTRHENKRKKRKIDELNEKLDQGYLLPNKKREDRRRKKVEDEEDEVAELLEMRRLLRKERIGKLSKKEVNEQLSEPTQKKNKPKIKI